jgi:molybdopterin synthase catalytic subunit
MQIKVLFFASYRDQTGTREIKLDLANITNISDLKAYLVELYPGLRSTINSALISIDNEFAFDEDHIQDHSEVAIFPPVSGGIEDSKPTYIALVEDKISFDECLSKITTEETGAACIFSGMVRGYTKGEKSHTTKYLVYEAYESMAEIKMQQIADEIRNHWPSIEGIVIIQRIGHLEPGEPTVAVACSAGHRHTGVFEATRYGIDRLKEIVPIWKKEVGPGGEQWVEGKYRPTINDKSW